MNKNNYYQWGVIGAGPAGIASVGKLLDEGIPSQEILWVDPFFSVGDLGKNWLNVSSNTKVDLFIKFLNAYQSFQYNSSKKPFNLDKLPIHEHCLLKEIAHPLQWVTDHLKEKVHAVVDMALSLKSVDNSWEITTKESSYFAKKIILATGSEPKQLSHPDLEVIPLDIALNAEKLKNEIKPEDVIAVFGASHSGVLILENLLNLNPKSVYNFYRSPHLYAVELDEWILFDNVGLKGRAAKWAKQHLDGTLPKNLQRIQIEKNDFADRLACCNKVVYAIGFKTREAPIIEPYPKARYQETIGVIAPGIFGLGIAYPQAQLDPLGNREHRVGLWKFIEYLNEVFPIWLKYGEEF